MKLRNLLLIALSSTAISAASNAIELPASPSSEKPDLKVKLSGLAHFQVGARFQDNLTDKEKLVSKGQERFGLFTQSAFSADFENSYKNIKYGLKAVLVPTAKRSGANSYNGSHLFFESKYGRVEVGSPISASTNMMLTGNDISTVAFSNFFRYSLLNAEHIKQNNMAPSFTTYSEAFLDDKLASSIESISYSNEPARSVSFYTPKFNLGEKNKVQLGITYIPDSSNTGISGKPDKVCTAIEERIILKEEDLDDTNDGDIVSFEIDQNVKNAFTAGLTFESNLAEGVDLKVGLTGEYGKPTGKAKRYKWSADEEEKVLDQEFDLTDMKTFNLGAQLSMGNFSLAGSYGSNFDSLTTKEFHKADNKTDYYGGTIAYNNAGIGVSVSAFHSNRFSNKLRTYSIGTNFDLAPGFKPYVGFAWFKATGKPEYYPNLKDKETSGTVALIGAKLSL